MIIFEFIKSHKNTELCFMDIPLIRKGDPLFDKKKYGLSITSNFGSFFPAFGFYLGKTDKWFNLVGFVEQEDKYELEPEGERFTRSFEHQGVNYIFHSGYAWTVRKGTNQIVDAKSGLTGAGKGLSDSSHFVNVHDNYVTYKLNRHQHIPEIVQQLKTFNDQLNYIQFSTSLLPVNRGIMATSYAKVKEGRGLAEIEAAFEKIYAKKPFVRIQKELPELHNVIGSNFTDIGFAYNPVTQIVTVIAVIDNLVKGAAGQAVQNLNLMMGWPETEGFILAPNYL